MTDANYSDDQDTGDQSDQASTPPSQAPKPRPGSTAALLNQPGATPAAATSIAPPKPTPPTPPTPYQAPPDQPNRVGPDQSPHGGLPPAGAPGGATPGAGPGPFGPYGLPAFRGVPRQTFIPSMANRPPGEWGTDRKFPMLPKAWEVPGIYRGLGRKLSQWGPGFVAPFAAMMGQHSGAWMQGYMRGQEQLARLQHQRMSMAAEETQQRMQTMMTEYQQIHAIFGDDPKNQAKLMQALDNAARKYQDDHMLSAIHTVGPEGAMGLLKWYDAQHSDLKASNKARADDEAQRERLGPYQLDPTDAAGLPKSTAPAEATPPAETPEATPPAATPDTTTKPDTGTPGDTGTPTSGNPDVDTPGLDISDATQPDQQQTEQADAGMTPEQQRFLRTATAAGASDLPDPAVGRLAQAQLPGVTVRPPGREPVPEADDPVPQFDPQNSPVLTQAAQGPWKMTNRNAVDQVAQDIVMGTSKITKKSDPELWTVANARAAEIKQKLDAIAGSNLTGKGALDQIRKVMPRFAGQLASYVAGQSPVPSGARNQPINPYILTLGHKVDPGWNENTAKVRFTMMKNWTSGQDGRQWLSGLTSMDHLDHLQELSDQLPDWYKYVGKAGAQIGQDFLTKYAPGWAVNTAGFEKARQAIIAYEATVKLVAPEIERAQKGAAGTQTENQHFVDTMGAAEDPEARRQIIASSRQLITNRTHNLITKDAAAMGVKPEALLAPYSRFYAGGGASDNGKAEDGSPGNAPVPTRPGFDLNAAAQRILREPTPPGGPNTSAPAAGPGGVPSGTGKVHSYEDYFK